MEYNELTHHGILGMKWGRRRYQNKDGSLTEEGRKRYGDGDGDAKETYEEGKAKAVQSGSAKEVLRYKGDLTQQEMQFALSRIKWEKEMSSINASETVTGKDRLDKFFDGVKTATGYAGKAIQAYNTVANIVNAFSDREVDLPKISTNLSNDNKELRKAQEKARKEANKLADEYDQAKEKQQKKEEKKAQKEVDDLKKEAEKQAEKEAKAESKASTKSDTESPKTILEDRTYDSSRKEVNTSTNYSKDWVSDSSKKYSNVETPKTNVLGSRTGANWAADKLAESASRTPVTHIKPSSPVMQDAVDWVDDLVKKSTNPALPSIKKEDYHYFD